VVVVEEDFIPISEVAERLGVPENTMRRYAKLFAGYLDGRQNGRVMKYSADAVLVLKNIRDLYAGGKNRFEIEEILGEKKFFDVGDDGVVVESKGEVIPSMRDFLGVMERMVDIMENQKRLEDEVTYLRDKVERLEDKPRKGWIKSLLLKVKGVGK